jgi:hypothetical protein
MSVTKASHASEREVELLRRLLGDRDQGRHAVTSLR